MIDNKQFNEATNFLETLSQGNPSEIFHFQTFDDQKNDKRISLNRVLVGTLEQYFEQLVQLNNQGAGVFVCVNQIDGPKRDAKRVVKIRSVFADKDDGNFEQFPIEPSMIVQTKNGQHAYWITDEVSCEGFTEMQKSIINTLKTDIAIHDLPRVMRLPGFYHRKDPNNIYYVTALNTNTNKYSLNDLFAAFPKVEVKKSSVSSMKGSHIVISKHIERLEGAVQGQSGDLKTFQVACDLVRGFNLTNVAALEYFKKYNEKCLPPWSESELMQKLESARKSGSGEFGNLLKNLTTEQWVYKFIEKNNAKTSYNQKIVFNNEVIPANSLVRKAEIQWDNEGRKSKSNVIRNVFEEWEIESKKGILKRTREVIKYNKNISYIEGQDPITNFTKALVGENCEKLLQHRAVIAHFIWQIKRKLFGYPVVHHMCPVLVGAQGCGKTIAIDNLIAPLKHLSMEGNLGTFVRENEKFVFGTYYIIKLDEFARGTKADLESMKNIITSPDVNYRTFYVQKMAYMPNISTFIGASNRSVAEIFNDQTGNRRFYEIPCLDKVDWSQIGGYTEEEGIDYNSLWKTVNEEDESPIMPFINEILKYQEGFRAKTFIEDWLISEELIPASNDSSELISVKKLHLDFMNWLKLQNCNFMFTLTNFGRELTKHLENKKRNDGSYYKVRISTIRQNDKPFSPSNLNLKDVANKEFEQFMASIETAKIVMPQRKTGNS